MEGDYYKPQKMADIEPTALSQYKFDGKPILYCGKCNAPKEVYLEFAGIGEGYISAMVCKCNRDYEKNQRSMDILMERKEVFNNNRALMNAFIEDDDKRDINAYKEVQFYINYLEEKIKAGEGLLFVGGVGVGKSWYSACIVNEAINNGYRCLFVTPSILINQYMESKSKNDFLFKLKGYNLIVLDDMGVIKEDSGRNEILFTIVDSIYNNGTSLIVTTNLSPSEISGSENQNTQRIFSRVCSKNKGVFVAGEDRRTNAS